MALLFLPKSSIFEAGLNRTIIDLVCETGIIMLKVKGKKGLRICTRQTTSTKLMTLLVSIPNFYPFFLKKSPVNLFLLWFKWKSGEENEGRVWKDGQGGNEHMGML